MLSLSTTGLIWLTVAIYLVGAVCTWAARASEGSCGAMPCQCIYFFCLAAVSILSICLMRICTPAWLLSGATLGTMIVGATCRGRRATEPGIA